MFFSPSNIQLERMVNAVELVRKRLRRAADALRLANVPYAVAGGNAVAAWVSTVDEAAARNTQDVDILLRRSDLGRAKAALEAAGFVHRHAASLDVFLDSPQASPRSAVHVVFAHEIVKAGEPHANPDVDDSVDTGEFRVLTLEALVKIKLTAFRDKDRTHLRDLIGVGLIDRSWADRLTTPLAERLMALLNDPEG